MRTSFIVAGYPYTPLGGEQVTPYVTGDSGDLALGLIILSHRRVTIEEAFTTISFPHGRSIGP